MVKPRTDTHLYDNYKKKLVQSNYSSENYNSQPNYNTQQDHINNHAYLSQVPNQAWWIHSNIIILFLKYLQILHQKEK